MKRRWECAEDERPTIAEDDGARIGDSEEEANESEPEVAMVGLVRRGGGGGGVLCWSMARVWSANGTRVVVAMGMGET